MEEVKIALKVNDLDNVATIFAENITVGNVPYGHKIAVKDIKKGEQITKYGEEIGVATHDIKFGEYVHVHNLDSMRGRGDLEKKGDKS